MKALTLLGAGEVRVSDFAEPSPQPGDLLLQVELAGFCGSDLNSFRGTNPLVSYPRVLGHEIAATVLKGNREIPAGTHVTVSPYTSCGICPACRRARTEGVRENACRHNQTLGVQRDGAIAERIAIPATKVYPSPTLTMKQLCLVEPLTVGFHAVARGRVTADDTVAVLGCGGVGLGAIAGAAARGARTIAVDLDAKKLRVAELAGATDLIDASRDDIHERLRALTNGDGPDVVLEAIGLPSTFQLAVEAVAFTGRVVYIGYAKEPVAYESRLFVQKELDILGSRNALPADMHAVMQLLEAGRFPVDEAITRIVSLDEAPAMLAAWSANPAGFTKIMIQMR
jgi:2-desacetyl-2-hydroxyethyl bacteriochlorophyllide A dehydrogenase